MLLELLFGMMMLGIVLPDKGDEAVESKEDETSEEKSEEETGTEENQEEESSTSEEETSENKDTEEVSDKDKRIAQLEAKLAKTQESSQSRIDGMTKKLREVEEKVDKGGKQTWDDLDIDQLKNYRTHYRKEGNDEMIDFLSDKIADRQAEHKVTNATKLQKANDTRASTWNKVISDYPDLKDKDSEHYKLTLDIIEQNPRLDNIAINPEGHAVAARLAAEDMMRGHIKGKTKDLNKVKKKLNEANAKTSLDNNSNKVVDNVSLDKLEQSAIDSGKPYGPEWKKYLKALEVAKKAKSKG